MESHSLFNRPILAGFIEIHSNSWHEHLSVRNENSARGPIRPSKIGTNASPGLKRCATEELVKLGTTLHFLKEVQQREAIGAESVMVLRITLKTKTAKSEKIKRQSLQLTGLNPMS